LPVQPVGQSSLSWLQPGWHGWHYFCEHHMLNESRETSMPFRFEFDSTHRILRGVFSDVVTDESIAAFYRLVPQYAVALDPLAGILDLSAVTSFEATADTIRRLAWSEPAMPHSDRPRFIVAKSSHIFGMARMFAFEGETARPNLHVLRAPRDVWAILGIHEPQFEALPANLCADRPVSP
jgi:hypothetical protein